MVSISDLAYIAGDVLGIGEFAGGVFCTFALFMVSTVILIMLLKDKVNTPVLLLEGVLVVSFCTALGWVDIWLIIVIVMICITILVSKGTGAFKE